VMINYVINKRLGAMVKDFNLENEGEKFNS
jgi:hypothetical protein